MSFELILHIMLLSDNFSMKFRHKNIELVFFFTKVQFHLTRHFTMKLFKLIVDLDVKFKCRSPCQYLIGVPTGSTSLDSKGEGGSTRRCSEL